jgi:hypothetical protein
MKINSSNRLTYLAADIQAAHRDIKASAEQMAERAIAAGNMLIEAKAALPHGKWQEWLSDQVGMSDRSARRYMQLARSGLTMATVADLGIRAAAEALAVARTEPHQHDGEDWVLEAVALFKCMIFSWARLPAKDRARIRMDAVQTFASSAKTLQLVPLYLRETEEMDRMLRSGEFDPFDMPVGDELFAFTKRAIVEMQAEDRG